MVLPTLATHSVAEKQLAAPKAPGVLLTYVVVQPAVDSRNVVASKADPGLVAPPARQVTAVGQVMEVTTAIVDGTAMSDHVAPLSVDWAMWPCSADEEELAVR